MSIFAAGKGGKANLNDLGLKTTYGSVNLFRAMPTYNDLMLEVSSPTSSKLPKFLLLPELHSRLHRKTPTWFLYTSSQVACAPRFCGLRCIGSSPLSPRSCTPSCTFSRNLPKSAPSICGRVFSNVRKVSGEKENMVKILAQKAIFQPMRRGSCCGITPWRLRSCLPDRIPFVRLTCSFQITGTLPSCLMPRWVTVPIILCTCMTLR
jgi:hypothetical protein